MIININSNEKTIRRVPKTLKAVSHIIIEFQILS